MMAIIINFLLERQHYIECSFFLYLTFVYVYESEFAVWSKIIKSPV